MLSAEEMGRDKDLTDFDKGQLILARQLDQNISGTVKFVGCSQSDMDST